ncbi:MAG: twin-arginine translocase subunit TatC, partial [Halanaeroarchaeum sp.]
ADADETTEESTGETEESTDEETVYDFQSDEVLSPEGVETADGDSDEGGFVVESDVDIQEGWDEYDRDLADRAVGSETSEEAVELPADDEVETIADDATPIERKTGPPSDREQPLADHIEEMIKRLGIVVVIAGLVSLAAFPFAEEAITFLWYSVLPRGVSQPHVYHPLELLLTQLKTASLLGLIVALPAFVYETYAFMKPGLYPHERRYYLAAVPTSLILALVGVTFAYFIVLPAVMSYFLYYSQGVVDIAFALGQTFNLMLILMAYLALVFQIPLFVMLAIMMGLTTREWLEDRRLVIWGVFAGVSFLFSPDPTGMAPLIVAATMIALFEGTLLLLRWTQRSRASP